MNVLYGILVVGGIDVFFFEVDLVICGYIFYELMFRVIVVEDYIYDDFDIFIFCLLNEVEVFFIVVKVLIYFVEVCGCVVVVGVVRYIVF